jgi:hypothetical protein
MRSRAELCGAIRAPKLRGVLLLRVSSNRGVYLPWATPPPTVRAHAAYARQTTRTTRRRRRSLRRSVEGTAPPHACAARVRAWVLRACVCLCAPHACVRACMRSLRGSACLCAPHACVRHACGAHVRVPHARVRAHTWLHGRARRGCVGGATGRGRAAASASSRPRSAPPSRMRRRAPSEAWACRRRMTRARARPSRLRPHARARARPNRRMGERGSRAREGGASACG